MKLLLGPALLAFFLVGCAMFGAWKTIPPPGGCGVCHTRPITANWALAYEPATLNSEQGRYSWQRPESLQPPESSPFEEQKVTEERCFRCHKGPDRAHAEYRGRYHH